MVESDITVDKPMNPAAEAEQMQSICSGRKDELKISTELKEAILSKLAAAACSNPSSPISPDLIQLRLGQYFPTFRTPCHPPYACMIRQAILELEKEGGSTEEAISRFIEEKYEGLPWAHASFLCHHLKKLCNNGEILCINNERYMLAVDDGYFGVWEEAKISHGSNIANRDGKEDENLVQADGRETEAIDGWSGVNGDQTVKSVDQFENERRSVEVNGQSKGHEQRILGLEEEKESKQESVEEVREESHNFSGQVEVVEEIDEVKAKVAEDGQEQRGEKRKKSEMTEQQIKVLEDYSPQPVMGDKKKCFVEQQQLGGNPQDKHIDIRTKILGFSCGGNLKRKRMKRRERTRKPQLTPLWECSMNLLKEKRKEALQHEGKEQRKPHCREKDLVIVCAQRQPRWRTSNEEADKLPTDLIAASLESRESGQILGQQLQLSSVQRPAELQITKHGSFTESEQKICKSSEIQNSRPKIRISSGTCKNIEELAVEREQEFQKSAMTLKFKIKIKKAVLDDEEATVSLPTEVKDSMNAASSSELHGNELQKNQIKVYVQRKVRTCQPKG